MPASGTAITVIGAPGSPAGGTYDEQQHDASPCTRFNNAVGTILMARNTNVAARTLSFFSDSFGVESTIMTQSIPGSATETGLRQLGPFPTTRFNDHSVTEAASTGQVMVASNGADADLFMCPIVINQALMV